MADIRIEVTAQPSLKVVETEIQALFDKFNGKKVGVSVDPKTFTQGTQEAQKMSRAVGEVNTATQKAGDSIGKMAAKVAQWAVATTLIYAPLKATKEALAEMKKVDTEMTVIRKVTGATREEMAALGAEAYKTAAAMGRVASEYVSAAAEFAKAGYGDRASELAELQLLTQTVGDVQKDIANQFLLSTDAAYKYGGSVDALTKVLDGANEIGNQYATSVEKIADGLGIVAPLAAQAGIGVDELTAALGTITAVTQRSGSEAARAFRALILNLRQVKDEVLDIETGEILDEATIKRSERSINSLGINIREIRDGLEQLRDPMEIIEEIASKWDTLTKTKPIAVQEFIDAVGGKMRSTQLVALIENFDMYQSMLTTYAESAGSALREQEFYLDSWEAKTNQLSATWTEFVSKTVQTDWIKGLIDGARVLIQSFGDLGTILVLAAVWFAALKTEAVIAGFAKLASSLSALSLGFKSTIAVLSILPAAMKVARAEGVTLSAALSMVSGGAITAEIALSALTAGLAVFALAITGGVMVYNNWKRAQEEARQAAIKAGDAMRDQLAAIDALRAKIEDETLSRDALVELMASHNKKYEDELAAIQDVNGAREEAIRLLDEEAKKRATETIRETGTEYLKAKQYLGGAVSVGAFGERETFTGTPEEALRHLNERIDEYNAKTQEGIVLTGTQQDIWKSFEKQAANLSGKIESSRQVVKNYDTAQSLLNGTYERTIEVQDELAETVGGAGKSHEQLAAAIEAQATATSALVSEATALSKAFAEQEEAGRLSAKTILELVEAGYAAALSIDTETGAVTLNAEAYKNLTNVKIQEQLVSIQATRTDTLATLEQEITLVNNLTNVRTELGLARLKEASAARAAAQQAYDDLTALEAGLLDLQANLGKVVGGIYGLTPKKTPAAKKATSEEEDELKKRFEAFKDYLADRQFLVDQLAREEGTEPEQVLSYEVDLGEIEKELVFFRSKGMTEADDYVQYLIGKQNELSDEIIKIKKKEAEEQKKIQDDLQGELADAMDGMFTELEDQEYAIGIQIRDLDDQIKFYENAMRDLKEETEAAVKPLQQQVDAYQIQIEMLESAREIEEQRNKLGEARLALLEKERALLNAQQERTVRTLVGGQWEWRVDAAAVQKAEEELSAARKTVAEAEHSSRVESLKQQQDIAKREIDTLERRAQISLDWYSLQVSELNKRKEAYGADLEDAKRRREAVEREWAEIQKSWETPARAISDILADIAEHGVPELKATVDAVVGILRRLGGGKLAASSYYSPAIESTPAPSNLYSIAEIAAMSPSKPISDAIRAQNDSGLAWSSRWAAANANPIQRSLLSSHNAYTTNHGGVTNHNGATSNYYINGNQIGAAEAQRPFSEVSRMFALLTGK